MGVKHSAGGSQPSILTQKGNFLHVYNTQITFTVPYTSDISIFSGSANGACTLVLGSPGL